MIDNTLVRTGFSWVVSKPRVMPIPPEHELDRLQAALEYSLSHNCRISFTLYGIDCTLDNRQYKPKLK